MSDHNRLAANVRAEMARRSVRQITVAGHLRMSQAAVSRRLSGETEFSVSELVAVAGLLGVTPASLLPQETASDTDRDPQQDPQPARLSA